MPIGHFIAEATILLLAGLPVPPLAGSEMHLQNEYHSSSPLRWNDAVLVRLDSYSSTQDEAARVGLEEVRELRPSAMKSASANAASEEYAKALGFSSAEEAGRADLGNPFYLYLTSLFLIKRIGVSDPSSLLISSHAMIYPLLVDQNVKSSLTVTKDPKSQQWRTTEWGSPQLIRRLEKQRSKNPELNFVVLISPQNPLGLRFVSAEPSNVLIPIADIPSLNLKEGIPSSAIQIFSALRTIANKYTDSQLEGLKPQTPQP